MHNGIINIIPLVILITGIVASLLASLVVYIMYIYNKLHVHIYSLLFPSLPPYYNYKNFLKGTANLTVLLCFVGNIGGLRENSTSIPRTTGHASFQGGLGSRVDSVLGGCSLMYVYKDVDMFEFMVPVVGVGGAPVRRVGKYYLGDEVQNNSINFLENLTSLCSHYMLKKIYIKILGAVGTRVLRVIRCSKYVLHKYNVVISGFPVLGDHACSVNSYT